MRTGVPRLAKHEKGEFSLYCGASTVTLSKVKGESMNHVLLKGLLWALLLPLHPDVACEVPLGMRYKPDVVALDDASGEPCWWGECGSVKPSKLSDLAAAFPHARFSVAKWGRSDLRGYAQQLVRISRSLLPTCTSIALTRGAPLTLPRILCAAL
jgi:hypothetical protein